MVKIRRHMAPLTRTSGRGNTAKYITIHETANRGRGAGAASHARLQANTNSRQASWHYQVDDKEIVQSFDDNVKCWHAGGTANSQSIAIEICVNSDSNYNTAFRKAAQLVAHLRKKHGIPANRIVSHKYWTGKNCPTIMLGNGRWNEFINLTGDSTSTASTSKPQKKASWFQMATKQDLRDVLKEERNQVWLYRGRSDQDAWAFLLQTHRMVEDLQETVGRKVWSYHNHLTETDIYGHVRETNRAAVEIQGELAGILTALEQIGEGEEVNLAEVRKAAQEGVSKALKSLEADVTLSVDAGEE